MAEKEYKNVIEDEVKTEAEILALGANSIIPGQTWITSDTKRIIKRELDGSFTFVFAEPHNGVEEAPVDGVVYGRKDEGWVNVDSIKSYIDFDPQSPAPDDLEGRLWFDDFAQTMKVHNDKGIDIQMGRTISSRFTAEENVLKGQTLYASNLVAPGVYGVKLAKADTYNENWVFGMAGNDALTGEICEFVQQGFIHGVDTSLLSESVPLYMDIVRGGLTNDRPDFPAEPIIIGAVLVKDAVNGVIGVNMTRDNYDFEFDGTILEKHNTTIVVDGGVAYLDLTNSDDPARDLPIQVSSEIYELNTTTGTGVGGASRVALISGSSTIPQTQYVYIKIVGGVPTVTVSAGYPSTPFSGVCMVSLLDIATTTTEGALMHRRFTTSKAHDGRGRISYISERLYIESPKWWSGVTPTATITPATKDVFNLSVIAGEVYQSHKQNFPSLSIDTAGVYLANGTGGTYAPNNYTKFSNLIDLCGYVASDIARDTSSRGQLVVFGLINKATQECKLMVNLPTDLYGGADSQAYHDYNGTATYSVSSDLRLTAFLIARVPYDLSSSNDVEFINPIGSDEIINLLGNPIGVTGGGSGGSSAFTPNLTQVLSEGNDAGGQGITGLNALTGGATGNSIGFGTDVFINTPNFLQLLATLGVVVKRLFSKKGMDGSGLWQVEAPEIISGEDMVVTGSDTPVINDTYTPLGTQDAGSGYGTFTYYGNDPVSPSWFIVRVGWWWMIATDKDDAWNTGAYYGSGGEPTPIGFFKPQPINGHTGDVEIAGATSGLVKDSIATLGPIYSDRSIKAKESINVGDDVVILKSSILFKEKTFFDFFTDSWSSDRVNNLTDYNWANPTYNGESFRVGYSGKVEVKHHLNDRVLQMGYDRLEFENLAGTTIADLVFNEDGTISAPMALLENITEPDDLATAEYADFVAAELAIKNVYERTEESFRSLLDLGYRSFSNSGYAQQSTNDFSLPPLATARDVIVTGTPLVCRYSASFINVGTTVSHKSTILRSGVILNDVDVLTIVRIIGTEATIRVTDFIPTTGSFIPNHNGITKVVVDGCNLIYETAGVGVYFQLLNGGTVTRMDWARNTINTVVRVDSVEKLVEHLADSSIRDIFLNTNDYSPFVLSGEVLLNGTKRVHGGMIGFTDDVVFKKTGSESNPDLQVFGDAWAIYGGTIELQDNVSLYFRTLINSIHFNVTGTGVVKWERLLYGSTSGGFQDFWDNTNDSSGGGGVTRTTATYSHPQYVLSTNQVLAIQYLSLACNVGDTVIVSINDPINSGSDGYAVLDATITATNTISFRVLSLAWQDIVRNFRITVLKG